MLTDTHTHLYSEAFDDDQDAMMRRALEKGVKRFFIPAIDSTYSEAMLRLEKNYPDQVYLMAGLHPTSVKDNYKEELKFVEDQLKKRKFYAVGETGIDLYWDTSTLDIQKKAFKKQIQLAKEHDLPIVIHCREAFDEVFAVLEEENHAALRGIFHCFTGNYDQAKQALSYNLKLGIGGVVTFKNGKIDTFLNRLPLENIVLETDSPYLAPAPFRGKRNESSYITYVCKKVSELYGISEEEVASITTQNSEEIFSV